ncbi:hypothetical protein AAG906_024482 [Vitis piasezkii]
MPESIHSSSTPDMDCSSVTFVHSINEAGRLLPSASRWNSIAIDYNVLPRSSIAYDSLPSVYSKSVEFNLVVRDKTHLKRFVYISVFLVLAIVALVVLLHFLPHKHGHHGSSKNLTHAINQALTFFEAQKSGYLPKNSSVSFRGDSGLQDGNSSGHNLVGGFYDSGNNIKFSFPTAYTITLLSWTVIEYHQKYVDIGELEHVKDIIKWGSDYLLKLFIPPIKSTSSSTTILYSQASCLKGFVGSTSNDAFNDVNCWQRPEDMSYLRPVSICNSTASDLAGEIVAALSAASLVFREDTGYSGELIKGAEKLFELATAVDPRMQGTYTTSDACGGQARQFYNSSGFEDELVWAGTWLNATEKFASAETEEIFFLDPGYPYAAALQPSTTRTDLLMCSYLSNYIFNNTPGGLILLRPDHGKPLQFAATASFLSKLYSDYLDLLRRSGGSCGGYNYTLEMLQSFSMSQVNYILGDNPMKMSYVVGFGDSYPIYVHHRSASIPWDGHQYSCEDGDKWLHSEDPNPNTLLGAMVGGPDQHDKFLDDRKKPWFTEPSISSNAGLVAALIALHDPPCGSSNSNCVGSGIDKMGIFTNIHSFPSLLKVSHSVLTANNLANKSWK